MATGEADPASWLPTVCRGRDTGRRASLFEEVGGFVSEGRRVNSRRPTSAGGSSWPGTPRPELVQSAVLDYRLPTRLKRALSKRSGLRERSAHALLDLRRARHATPIPRIGSRCRRSASPDPEQARPRSHGERRRSFRGPVCRSGGGLTRRQAIGAGSRNQSRLSSATFGEQLSHGHRSPALRQRLLEEAADKQLPIERGLRGRPAPGAARNGREAGGCPPAGASRNTFATSSSTSRSSQSSASALQATTPAWLRAAR